MSEVHLSVGSEVNPGERSGVDLGAGSKVNHRKSQVDHMEGQISDERSDVNPKEGSEVNLWVGQFQGKVR